jgi:hypothetical protein
MAGRTEVKNSTLPMLALLALLVLSSCANSPPVSMEDIQRAVDAGGTVGFPAGTYLLTRTIVVRKSNTILQGAGPRTVFVFKPSLPQLHCINDRAFTTPCNVADSAGRQIASSIALGSSSFEASDNVDDLRSGDWLIVEEKDSEPSEVVIIDWAQVATAFGNTVVVRSPFRTAFPNLRLWQPGHSGLGFLVLPQSVEGVQFRDFTVLVPDSGFDAPGISVFAAQNTVIDHVEVQDPDGQPLYSYLSQGLTVTNSRGYGNLVLNEFAATVDLSIRDSVFASNDAALGLDFGTGFLEVDGNAIPSSVNIGMYLLDGVHDGRVTRNSIQFVRSSSSAVGMLARGTQRVTLTNNYLAGGEGPASLGISIGSAYDGLSQPIFSFGNVVTPNLFGPFWSMDYDPTNQP